MLLFVMVLCQCRMPVWQYDSAAKTVTRWRYSPLGSHIPIFSEVRCDTILSQNQLAGSTA